MKHIVMAVVVGMATCTAHAEDAGGYWNGAIGNSLNVIIHFNNSVDGRWEATMSVPKQNLETGVETEVIVKERALNQALFAAMVSERKLEEAKPKASLVMDDAERWRRAGGQGESTDRALRDTVVPYHAQL